MESGNLIIAMAGTKELNCRSQPCPWAGARLSAVGSEWHSLSVCGWMNGPLFCMSVGWWGRNRGGFYRRRGWSSSDATWSVLVEGEEEGAERAERQPRVALREEKSCRIFLEIFVPTVSCSPGFPQILKKTISYVLLCIFGSYGFRQTCDLFFNMYPK